MYKRQVIVEKVNMVSKHVKPRKMGQQGGIVKAEGAMYASRVQIVCPRCKKQKRVAHKIYGGIPILPSRIAMVVSLFLVSRKIKVAVGELPVSRMHPNFGRNYGIT